MRQRSGGLHAESQEGYLKLAELAQNRNGREIPFFNVSRRNSIKSPSRKVADTRYGGNSPFIPDYKPIGNRDIEFEEFDYEDNSQKTKIANNSPSVFNMDSLVLNDSTEMDAIVDDISKIEYNLKIMMVGGRNTGKHSLLNSLFGESKTGDEVLEDSQNCFDLIIKRKEDIISFKKYHFWIQELEDNRYDTYIKLYYHTVQLFIFVYSVDDHKSFEQVDESIASIIKEAPKKKFCGILIANKNDKVREVDYDEGFNLKQKYGLSWFIETNIYIESQTPQIIRKIDDLIGPVK